MAARTPIAEGRASAPGMRVGKYEVLRHIASGGMAEIHLARAVGIQGFEKLVVIKRMLPNLVDKREYVAMFLDEARLAARLQHSNIVQVYDIGSDDGDYYFVMEYLHGVDLGALLQSHLVEGLRVPLEIAIYVAIGLCAGLHHAHELTDGEGNPLGVVHRDISPQNVFLTFDGGVKIVDFGIAKAQLRQSKTRHGTLKGKVPYMSPEQCRAGTLDRRSDVFSIAILLWEMTTTKRLFRGAAEFDLMKQIVERDAPSPATVIPDYPRELERIVQKGLARERRERYQTAQELQLDLEAFARDARLAVSPVGLERILREFYEPRITAWKQAQRQGKAFAQHIAEALAVDEKHTRTMQRGVWNEEDVEEDDEPPEMALAGTQQHDEVRDEDGEALAAAAASIAARGRAGEASGARRGVNAPGETFDEAQEEATQPDPPRIVAPGSGSTASLPRSRKRVALVGVGIGALAIGVAGGALWLLRGDGHRGADESSMTRPAETTPSATPTGGSATTEAAKAGTGSSATPSGEAPAGGARSTATSPSSALPVVAGAMTTLPAATDAKSRTRRRGAAPLVTSPAAAPSPAAPPPVAAEPTARPVEKPAEKAPEPQKPWDPDSPLPPPQ